MSGARIALPRPWRTVAARPRSTPSPRRRRRGLVLAGAAAVVLVAAWYWGRDLSLWSVDSVRVTGATGHLGKLVVEGLLEKLPADQVVAAVRTPEKAAGLAERLSFGKRLDGADRDPRDRHGPAPLTRGVDRCGASFETATFAASSG